MKIKSIFKSNCLTNTIVMKSIAVVWLIVLALQANSQVSTTTPASRCGEGTVVLHATKTTGTLKWYTVPFYGTPISQGVSGDGTTFTTPFLVVSTTYYVDAVDASNCSLNPGSKRVPVTATISASSIQASIFYQSTTFCKSVNTPQPVTRTGTSGGVYSYTSGGGTLSLNTSTGEITPSTSSVGTYTVTYTVTASEGCVESPASTQVTITNAPLASSISYTGSPYCTSSTSALVSLTNDNNGTFSASPSGLSIDPVYGTINPSLSLPGTYTVTYLVSGAGGCAPQAPTASVTITGLPTATITYTEAPFCKDLAVAQTPVVTGTGAYTGGTFSATGLTINSSTGAITPSTNNAGTYTVYYTIPASGNCASVQTSTSLTINPLPTASISGTTSVCQNAAEPEVTFTGTAGTAPFTFTYTVNGGASQAVTTSSGSSVTVSQTTVSAGTYAYSLVSVTDANGCSASASGTATVTVTGTPIASFSYIGSPFCRTGSVLPTFAAGGSAGTFSGTGVTFVSTSTGEINLSVTPAGTYTIKNTISTCGSPIEATSSITINELPTAEVSGTIACGSSVLTATTDATAPSYVWYKNGVAIQDSVRSKLVATADGNYTIKVTDGSNGCERTSSAYALTIIALPTASISGTLTTCNTSTTLTAVTNAANASYVWYKNDEEIAGQTGSTLTVNVSGQGTPSGTGNYKVKVTNGTTTCENTATVFVTIGLVDDPGAVTADHNTVCTDASNTTVLTSSGTKSTILEWQKSIDGGANWTSIEHTSPTYTATGLTQTTSFRVKVQNGICDVTYSTSATVTVVADPTLSQLSNASICRGGNTVLSQTVSGGTGTFNYQWQYSANGTDGWSNVVDGTPSGMTYTNSSTASLSINGSGTESLGDNYYKCVLTLANVAGCGCTSPIETSPITVTVVADPSWASITQPATAVDYGTPVTFAATIANGLGGTISWIRSTTSGGAGTTVTSPDTPPAVGTYYYRPKYTPTGSGCNLADGTETTVTVSAKALTITANNANKTYGSAITGASGSTAFTASGLAGSETVGSVTIAYGTGAAATDGVATYTGQVTPSAANGGTFTASNYSITYATGNIIVDAASLTVTASAQSKNYGSTVSTSGALGTTFTVSGLQNSDAASGVTLSYSGTPTGNLADAAFGNYTITPSALTLSAGSTANYSITYNTGTLTVGNIALTVTANNTIRGVGETTPAYSYTMSGFANAETEAALRTASTLSGSVTYTDDTGGSTAAGTYTITPVVTGLIATNYTFTAATGTLTIANVVVDATGGTTRAGYSTLAEAYTAINNGTHTGTITVTVYANTSETSTATLNSSGGSASYTSVTIVAKNNVTITGSASPLMILGN